MRLGIDLGGTKIEGVVLDHDGAERARLRRPTPRGEYRAILSSIRALVEELSAQVGFAGDLPIGIGIPGSLSPATGQVRNANTTELNGERLDQDLQEVLNRPVRVENDANCFAIAEARLGAGRRHRVVFGVILGTGTGAGISIDGVPLSGRNAVAGEWGHMPLPRPTPAETPGPLCYCGRRGCMETWVSGPGLVADHARETDERLTAQEIAARAATGNAAAQATLDRHLSRVARGLAQVTNVLDPDVIVLGGGVSNISYLVENLAGAMQPHVFSDCFLTEVVPNQIGDSAGVIGAAWLWPNAQA